MKKTQTLIVALLLSGASFGQLNNCINQKDHPLVAEIKDSINGSKNYRSILAYTVVKGDRIGLSNSKILNLAYAWAACKKIPNPASRKEEEFKFLDAILTEKEFENLLSYTEKNNSNGKVQQE